MFWYPLMYYHDMLFRSDVAYDWESSLGEIALDTVLQKEDCLSELAKKERIF